MSPNILRFRHINFPRDLPLLYALVDFSVHAKDSHVKTIIDRAADGEGLSIPESAVLLAAQRKWEDSIFEAAAKVNAFVTGKTITFYGVVYIHDFCINHCTYCGDSIHAANAKRTLLTQQELVADVKALLTRHPLKEICFLMGEDRKRFKPDDLVTYLQAIASVYQEKIILNIPPLNIDRFRDIRLALPHNRLQFRVFQETYDAELYQREHLSGPKIHYDWRLNSQARALDAGFDEVGHGVLYGLNDKKHGHAVETLSMLAHAQDLYERFGKRSQSMSFPRVLPAPDIDFHPPAEINDETLIRCISVVKLAAPQIETIITCRESESFRRLVRPIVNIEDFAARPGPGGNSITDARQQMFLKDLREGDEIREEIVCNGYTVR
ncbi:MAG: hypothetical protein PHO08_05980 [Methylococcales bacterium]|nr:hypothetical protein [Methylococcales bacterium]